MLFIAEIDSLDTGEAGCFASNSYLADFFGVTAKYTSTIINKLIEKGLVESTIDKAAGNRRSMRVLSHKIGIGVSHENRIPYPTKEGYPIPQKKDALYKEDNKEDNKEERESPPLLSESDEIKKLENMAMKGSLKHEEKSRLSYLDSKAKCQELSDQFIEFFEREVLGRFDKYLITPAILADWHRQVWAKFGDEITTAAVSDHLAKIRSWQPTIARVIKIAKEIAAAEKKKAAAVKGAEQRAAARQAQQDRSKLKPTPITEWSDKMLTAARATAQVEKNGFSLDRIDREIKRRAAEALKRTDKESLPTETKQNPPRTHRKCKLGVSGGSMAITCTAGSPR